MATIEDLKKKLKNTSIEDLTKQAAPKSSFKEREPDPTIWHPTFDKEKGIGSAEVRFLPAHEEEDTPWVKLISYGFKGPTAKWYVENSPTTFGGPDPVYEMVGRLYNSGVESDKEEAKKYKRRVSYILNVYVISDPANPDNNGKVFKWKVGPKIWGFIQTAMNPPAEFEDEVPMNPFDPFEGGNFVIKMVGININGDIVPNYDKCYFKQPSPLFKDEEKILEVYNKIHKLQPLVDKTTEFKSYDQLKNRLFEVLGPTVGSGVNVISGNFSVPEEKKVDVVTETKKKSVIREERVEPAKLEVGDKKSIAESIDDEFDRLFNS